MANMAAVSGGVEWSQLVKPILAASYGSINKQDLPELVKAIVKSKEDILHHEEQYEGFYASFTVLAADYLANNAALVSVGGLNQTVHAAKILLQYMVNKVGTPPISLSTAPVVAVSASTLSSTSLTSNTTASTTTTATTTTTTTTTATSATPSSGNEKPVADKDKEKDKVVAVQDKHLLGGIKALCRGSGALHRADQAALTTAMKAAKLPPHIKTAAPDSGAKEVRKGRIDPSALILEQLISPLHDLGSRPRPPPASTPPASGEKDSELPLTGVSDPSIDMKNLFASRCVSALQSLGGGEQLIDMCLRLPTIVKFTQRYKDLLEGKGHGFPATPSEALICKAGLGQVLMELCTVWRVVSLPLLEPLNATRLQKLSTIAMAALLAALTVADATAITTVTSQATSSSKTPPPPREDDIDSAAPAIAEKALDLFNVILNAVRTSTRAGGHHVQNLQLMGSWLLMTGLHNLMLLVSAAASNDKKDEKGRSPSKKDSGSARINLTKVQQGFGVVCVALASQGVTLMTGLLEDVKVEGWTPPRPPEPARLDPLESYTATERLARLFSSIPLNQLLFYLATIAYRKACNLKRTHRTCGEGDTFSISDSTTYYDDDFSEGSLGEEDDDSVIIGPWFEESTTPGEGVQDEGTDASSNQGNTGGDTANSPDNSQAKTPHRHNSEVTTIVPEKGEPHGYISLASHIFLLMNSYLVESECAYVEQYMRAGLAETHMVVLAAIIRDLDREAARSDSGSLTCYLGPVLGSLYDEFSYALYRFTHNVIASGLLSETLQSTLLAQLGVSPWTPDGEWPLQVLPRTLAVLAQVLLLRQRRDKDELKCDSDTACVLIWHRVIATLTKSISNPPPPDVEAEDLNVEHAQLLLFLFHSLQLMQKKCVLLGVASAIVNVAHVVKTPMRDTQVLHLARLLLIFDYLMKNLYEAPQHLIEQVQWNLFKPISMQCDSQTSSKDSGSLGGKLYHVWRDLEENYRKNSSTDEAVMRPRFYTLTPSETNTQDTPKLDGLACSFILATPDTLKYSALYETLINLLDVCCQCSPTLHKSGDPQLSHLGLCGVQYAFSLAYRLILTMPPSVSSLELLSSTDTKLEGASVFYALLWGPRASHKIFNGWIKDGLVRQSLTTQKADALLKSVAKVTRNIKHELKMANNILNYLLNKGYSNLSGTALLTPEQMPALSDLTLLDTILSSLQVAVDEACQKGDLDLRSCEAGDLLRVLDISPDQLPISSLLKLVQGLTHAARWSLLQQMNGLFEEGSLLSSEALQAYCSVLAVAGSHVPRAGAHHPSLTRSALHAPLKTVIDYWNSNNMQDFPALLAWRNSMGGDILPGESYVSGIIMGHIGSLSSHASFSINTALKHVMHTLITFTADLACWCTEDDKKVRSALVNTLVALSVDATCDHVADAVSAALDKLLPQQEDGEGVDQFHMALFAHQLTHVAMLLRSSAEADGVVDAQILEGCVSFLEQLLESTSGKAALHKFFSESNFASVLLSPPTTSETFSTSLATYVIKFFIKLFQLAEKNSGDASLAAVCSHVSVGSWLESGLLQRWLSEQLLSSTATATETTPDSWQFLKTLTAYIVAQTEPDTEEVSHTLLKSLVPLGAKLVEGGTECIGNLTHLLPVMTRLAGAGSGSGHITLFRATSQWIMQCKQHVVGEEKSPVLLEAVCYLLNYINDIVAALKMTSERWAVSYRSGITSPPNEPDLTADTDSDWVDELTQEDEDSGGEDSDEDSMCNKLCTFTTTQKEFMNQHWYHCHTCRMVDGVGVCTVCARVCHRGHDVTYAKFGSFFCDCGAKEDGTCQALVKRSPASYEDGGGSSSGPAPFGVEPLLPSSLRRRPSSPTQGLQDKPRDDTQKQRQALAKQLESVRDLLIAEVSCSDVAATVLDLLRELMPTIEKTSTETSAVGSYQRALHALHQVHTSTKNIEQSEHLMVATVGSQEGAFENVRLNYSGDQGQTIRQLVSAHMIRRVAMCCLTSPGSKRQHLAVSHEKGKITVLQLSSLLKQHDSAKRKLTLTRLSSAPVPFTVLSITANAANDDFLAVCGLKDCHVLTFSSTGSVADHLVLHPQLESGNYIIKALWLPGQQTQLALITADFVKIYDLSLDSLSPQYYFLLPSGKIKDACFVCSQDGSCSLVVMASSGYIYTQVLSEESSARHGPFYVTNVLHIQHSDLKDSNGQIGGGGVSIFYSHNLQLLMFSYAQGKNFIAPVTSIGDMERVETLFLVTLKGGNGSGGKVTLQSLCQWSEVPGHPGLISCLALGSNYPVILMIKPDSIQVQEIRVVPAKSKMTDLVALRHSLSAGHEAKTTLILLCEDGSLRIYNANPQTTEFWLSSQMQSFSSISTVRPSRKKKTPKLGRPTGAVSFPVDFFEHCSVMNDIEFGGNDLLQIYNVQQLKNRLNSQGMYVASTKPGGFQLEAGNQDSTLVICGIRVAVGAVDAQKVPSYIEIFGRSVAVSATRSRWFDVPLTREESLQADKRIVITFGPSSDPAGVTMVDSVKIYGKTKDDFGWPEEPEDFPSTVNGNGNSNNTTGCTDTVSVGGVSSAPQPLTHMDRLVAAALETLDGYFVATATEAVVARSGAMELATKLLNLPLPTPVQHHTRALLASLHPSRTAYHNHKDGAQLGNVVQELTSLLATVEPQHLDCEVFHRLLVTARSVAVTRPHNLVKFTEKKFDPETPTSRSEEESPARKVEQETKSDTESKMTPKKTEDGKGPEGGESSAVVEAKAEDTEKDEKHFLNKLMVVYWALHKARPPNPFLGPVCQPGLTYVEATVQALVEIIHAYTVCSLSAVPLAVKLYTQLLLCSDTAVSFAAKQALIRVLRPRQKRRKVFIPSPPRCSTPGVTVEEGEKTMVAPVVQDGAGEGIADAQFDNVEAPEHVGEAGGEGLDALGVLGGGGIGGALGGALMGGMLGLPADDDDAMVELAIALSLHDDQAQAPDLAPLHGLVGFQGLQRLQGLSGPMLHSLQVLAASGLTGAGAANNAQPSQQDGVDEQGADGEGGEGQENGHYSDTTASANGSDDDDGEGSTAATDGSNLRASPAEQAGSGGSESGGSGVESFAGEHNVSGRSSAYGDPTPDSATASGRDGATIVPAPLQGEALEEEVLEGGVGLHTLRLALLDSLITCIPRLTTVGGVTSIPFFQVVLMLSSDLDGNETRDRTSLNNLLTALMGQLHITSGAVTNVSERNAEKEVQLVVMRLLSVMMSRSKSSARVTSEASSILPQSTASALVRAGAMEHCLALLKALLEYWQAATREQGGTVIGGGLLKPRPLSPPPDMSPFFLRQYVKGHAHDVFAAFPHLLTEMVLRLPYQMKKLGEGGQFEPAWSHYLCEYMMTQQTPFVRRQVRKLLLFICGNKDKYRQMRDMHALEYHIKDVKVLCAQGGFSFTGSCRLPPIVLPYDSLIQLIEHLKSCVDIATSRTANWQKYCHKDESVLGFLMEVACLLEEGVAPTVIQLLQAALCPAAKSSDSGKVRSGSSKRSSSEDPETDGKGEEAQCALLVTQVNRYLDKSRVRHFMHTFLLESNSTSVRWQAHSLILALYRHSPPRDQDHLLTLMWALWPHLPAYGRKAAQFVDLLGYFSLKTHQSEKKVLEYIDKAVGVLRTQSQLLANHPNASLYNMLASLVEFDGYYLESEPCLVCNNPEVPFTSVKLSTVKVDSRFTTTTQLVKLVGSHMISRLTLRVADLKRTKMVRTLNIYYNNRSVQAVVELKNKPSMWHKAKKVLLSAGQTEVKIDFPLPIVACNLMFEYADFYENLQASTETLQCPRCSAAVPASPGVCANCGENVYQCHKCRAINYDEKDPFLCNACGYCKYAKFDYTLHTRPCCAVDPIESEDDRKKAVLNINSLLDKADRSYKQLQAYKPTLELLLVRISEQGAERSSEENSSSGTQVNRAIQQLAQKYCGDCKNSFDDLSKVIQRVQASRRELVTFDRSQKEGGKKGVVSPVGRPTTNQEDVPPPSGRCYGCAAAATEHCITLLRALATNPTLRAALCSHGLIHDLLEYNLRRGSMQVRNEVRQLLCLLTQNDIDATRELNGLIMDKISLALRSHVTSPDLAASVRHEMALLAAAVQKEDSCWELRLRCVVQLFLMASGSNTSPTVMEHITLPCLRILQGVMRPPTPPPPRKSRDKAPTATTASSAAAAAAGAAVAVAAVAALSSTNGEVLNLNGSKVGVNVEKWLMGDPKHSFEAWRKRTPKKPSEAPAKVKKEELHVKFLAEKFGNRWLAKTIRHQYELHLIDSSWLRRVLFNPSSRMARQVTAQMIESLCWSLPRKKEMLDMLTNFLGDIGTAGECATEYVSLYQSLIMGSLNQAQSTGTHWKHYLALKGVLPRIAALITAEIQHLTSLEETTLTTDLSQVFAGYALKVLTEMLSLFVEDERIKTAYKGRLVGTVLSGYLSLRKLVVQRTKLIDDTQDKFLELLEEMTSGTESETKEFMAVCVETVKQYPADDLRTPVFIFERLCSIIFPEENDVGELFMTLEKDPQQEDFLQGRMLGNPYSSLDSGLGPHMRDVKNKICQDCELVALLEDDNGMELLVCNKIISLDLPVKEVYKNVWLCENNESDTMRIIYRMRGLLGDATEEFVETLDKKKEEDVDNEQVYRMAAVMSECAGLEVMLECLYRISDLSYARPLVMVLLKLFQFCVKVRVNRSRLIDPSLNAISTLLHTLKQCLAAEPEVVAGPPGGASLTEQLLQVLEAVLVEASTVPASSYAEFVETCGTLEDIHLLLNYVASSTRTNAQVRQRLMRVLPFLVFCHKEKMELLVGHFKPVLNFAKFDAEHSSEDIAKMESFCVFCDGIERNEIGNQLKDMIIRADIVKDALAYIENNIPASKKLVVVFDEEWKEFLSKPSVKHILRLLTGLASKHRGTQQAVAATCIPAIHRLEQISSDEHVGSLAENLLEALRDDPAIAQQVQDVRRQTRQEKKRRAMLTRKRELNKLGLRANDKEQITSQSALLTQMEEIADESGLVCAICLEGYRCQPHKVLAIYTFSKRCPIEEFENKAHKTQGYCTVSHFNIVHVDCHLAAVRSSRSRDEWDSAALHNANTRANGLLPLWGPQVPESAFASCLARHNTYVQDCTTHRDISYASTLHDLKLLLLRFALEKSFSDDSGGGGPQSNLNLIPYILHMALYVINTTRSASREELKVQTFLEMTPDRWLEGVYDCEGPFFLAVTAMAVMPSTSWSSHRITFLQRLLATVHARAVSPQPPSGGTVTDKTVKDWTVYKSAAIFWSLVDAVFKIMFKKAPVEGDWSTNLAEFIRHNDQSLVEASSKILTMYQQDLLPSTSFSEFCDVTGLLGDIENPDEFLSRLLQSLP
ncbi:E3 ubiquitin-protein ligase-like protein poe isoform X2 [Oratosquilla oratoria]|uniref:E3 ubiquitin-protein ligase-like protein poe isoform X2 n=1 Tax=Oratosquilla oratoria TaxID=337810 RepID=UPI003F75F16E